MHLNQLPAAFSVSRTPYLDIGGLGGEDREFNVRNPWLSAVQLQNGTIVAKDYSRLVFFSRTGDFVRVAGRRGRGPGELLQTRELCAIGGDRLLVVDQIGKRVTLWDSAGVHLGTFVPLMSW